MPKNNDILVHHGVKGMRWGVTRDGNTSSTTTTTSRLARKATDVTVTQKPGTFVRTAGGKKQTASTDAVKVAATRQLAKKSTTDSLSNKQLQDAVTRMNLEQQYSKLVKQTDRRTRGQRFVHKLMGKKDPGDNSNNNNNNGQKKKGQQQTPVAQKVMTNLVGEALKNATKQA